LQLLSDIRTLPLIHFFHNTYANLVVLLDMPLVSRRSDFQVLTLLKRKKISLAIIANTGTVRMQPWDISPSQMSGESNIENVGGNAGVREIVIGLRSNSQRYLGLSSVMSFTQLF
jgi:hypothetical protein